MAQTRRQFLQSIGLGTLAAATGATGLVGCETTGQSRTAARYGSDSVWPDRQGTAPIRQTPWDRSVAQAPPPPVQPQQPALVTRGFTSVGGVQAIARSSWTTTMPRPGSTNPMNGISRITVHHEGMDVVTNTDAYWNKSHVEYIRNSHVKGRGWGDIGYHLVIDPAGRIYEGRPLSRQGAHVKGNNEHNLGILIVGNFERQNPSTAQLSTLSSTLKQLQGNLRVATSQVFTHREINPTKCPGQNLQPRVDSIRSRYLA